MKKIAESKNKVGLACLLCWFCFSCSAGNPIRIGFAGELSGLRADLGIQARNGAVLAVEEINASGGVLGRELELVVFDDKGTPEGAAESIQALIADDVLAIIGQITSEQTLVGYKITEPADIVLFSPGSSTPVLNKRQDNFFRIFISSEEEGRNSAYHIYNNRNVRDICIIYDEKNEAYAKPLMKEFSKFYEGYGGAIKAVIPLNSERENEYANISSMLKTLDFAGIYLIASAIDTAIIAQSIRLANLNCKLFAIAWAHEDTLIENGGHAVEGIEIFLNSNPDTPNSRVREFQDNYEKRFNRKTHLLDDNAYDIVNILAQTLENRKQIPDDLGAALLDLKNYDGINGTINIDKYGEARVSREWYVVTVNDSEFETAAPIISKQ